MEEPDNPERSHGPEHEPDEPLEEQERKGYGEDEGERDEALPE